MSAITTIEALEALYGPASTRAAAKEIDHLDHHCRHWLEKTPFILLATCDGTRLDVSPKGDAPGFVQVEDAHHILIPDWPGNNRIDGLRNILSHPQVALIAIIPNVKDTLRIAGRATIHAEEALRARFATRGKIPITVTRIKVEEVFMHCPKAFMRAKLWEPETWPERNSVPTLGEIIKDHSQIDGPIASPEEEEARFLSRLY